MSEFSAYVVESRRYPQKRVIPATEYHKTTRPLPRERHHALGQVVDESPRRGSDDQALYFLAARLLERLFERVERGHHRRRHRNEHAAVGRGSAATRMGLDQFRPQVPLQGVNLAQDRWVRKSQRS